MRVLWQLQMGSRPLLCNRPIFDADGNHLFTPDLLDPVAGIVGEYDGADHRVVDRRRTDLDRIEREARELGSRLGLAGVTAAREGADVLLGEGSPQ